MHDIDSTRLEFSPEYQHEQPGQMEGESEGYSGEAETGAPLAEQEEEALAAELLGVSSEAEMDHFLDGLFKNVVGAIGGAASQLLGKNAGPLGNVLKGLASKALPFIGGALGSAIPIPGVGTAIGSAVGSAASKLLQSETEHLEGEEREYETARRYVRFASNVIRNAVRRPLAFNPTATANLALRRTLQGWRQSHPYGGYGRYRDWRRDSYDRWGRHRGWPHAGWYGGHGPYYGQYGPYGQYSQYGQYGQMPGAPVGGMMPAPDSDGQWPVAAPSGVPTASGFSDASSTMSSSSGGAPSFSQGPSGPPCPPCPVCPICSEPSAPTPGPSSMSTPPPPTAMTPTPIGGSPGGVTSPPPGGGEFEQEFGYAGEAEAENYYDNNDPCAVSSPDGGRAGRWVRRGRKIVLYGL